MESADSLPSHQKPQQPLCCEFHYFPGNPDLNRKPWNPLLPPAEFIELYKELSGSIWTMSKPNGKEHSGVNGSQYCQYPPVLDDADVLGSQDKLKSLVVFRGDDCTSTNRIHSTYLPWQTGMGSSNGRHYQFDATASGGGDDGKGGGKSSDGEQNKGSSNKEKCGSESSNFILTTVRGRGRLFWGSRSGGQAGNGNSRSSDSGGDDGDEGDDKKRGNFGHRGTLMGQDRVAAKDHQQKKRQSNRKRMMKRQIVRMKVVERKTHPTAWSWTSTPRWPCLIA